MPRSFLVRTHQGCRKPSYGPKTRTDEPPCRTHESSLLHSDVPHRHHHIDLTARLQCGAQARSSSCDLPLRPSQLHPPSSPDTPPLPSEAHRCPVEVYQPAESCTTVKIRCVTGAPSPQSLPLLALLPAVLPSSSSQESSDCLDCRRELLRLSGRSEEEEEEQRLRNEWSRRKLFICRFCQKEYGSLGALKMHIRTHTLPCVCKVCGKAFSRPWLLQGHIRTHTGEKPFSCLHCSRAFADRSNLRAHLQTHSKVKRYQCGSCRKTFSRISLLAKHQEAGCPMS